MKADKGIMVAIVAGGVAGVLTALYAISKAQAGAPTVTSMAGLGRMVRVSQGARVVNRFPSWLFNRNTPSYSNPSIYDPTRGTGDYGSGYSTLRH